MKDFLSSSITAFTAFLSEKEKDIRNQVNPCLVSFGLDIQIIPDFNDPIKLIHNFDLSLYYEKPDEQFSFTALGSCLEITENGSGRFAASVKKIKEWQSNFFTNMPKGNDLVYPIFVGGAKFMVEHSDEYWKDFSDSTWFVPDFLFLKAGIEKKLLINFIFQPGNTSNGLIKKFEAKLKILQSIEPYKGNSSYVKLISTEGETPKDKKKWKQMIESNLHTINSGKIDKIVLSRKVALLFSEEQDIFSLHGKLKSSYTNCYNFIFKRGNSLFFGASPERLAKFSKSELLLEALAGSAPRGKNDEEENNNINKILLSKKNVNEHNFVVEHIKNNCKEFVHDLSFPEKPAIKKLPNIQHLSTEIKCKLNENVLPLTVIDKLFPTPAICGAPTEKALQLIKKHENHQRGLYSGLIGWFNFDSEGEFVIAIRSALLNGKRIFAYAGCGIVQDSNPSAEYNESELKLKPILSLFRQLNENK